MKKKSSVITFADRYGLYTDDTEDEINDNQQNKEEFKYEPNIETKNISAKKRDLQIVLPTMLETALLFFLKKITESDTQGVFNFRQISDQYRVKKQSIQRALKNVCVKDLARINISSKGTGGFIKCSLTKKSYEVLEHPSSKLKMKLFYKNLSNKRIT